MVAIQVLSSIAMIVFSFVGGFILFYVMSPLSKAKKKEQLDEMVNQLVNFVLFIWLSKIVLNFTVFIKDPVAILAYPANAHAFYLAALFTTITLTVKGIRQKTSVPQFLLSFIPVFLVASFLYEFMQIVWGDMMLTWYEIGLLGVLVLVYILLHGRIEETHLTLYLVLGWGIGKVTLALILPFTTLFGYMMTPWFIIVSVCILSVYIYRERVA